MKQRSFTSCLTSLACATAVAIVILGCDSGKPKQAAAPKTPKPPASKPAATTPSTSTPAAPASGETTPSAPPKTAASGEVQAGWGHLLGRIVLDGPVPEPAPLKVDKDVEVCTQKNLVNESLVVNKENQGIANVLVRLYLSRTDKAPQPHPSYAENANGKIAMSNHFCRFEPHVTVYRIGQTLDLLNKDTIVHNMNIATLKNPAANSIIPAGGSQEKTYTEAEARPTQVTCNIHPWMLGWLVVTDHPYVVATDADGRFNLQNLPTGEWSFQFWQENAGYLADVSRGGKAETWSKGRVDLTIQPGDNDLGEILVKPAVFEQ